MIKTITNTNPIDYIAIDVYKASPQVQDDQCSFAIDNDSKGYLKLLSLLKSLPNPLVVFQASGCYHRDLCEFLHKKAIPLAMVNPPRIRDFDRSESVRAKTDPIHTKIILAFAKKSPACDGSPLRNLHQARGSPRSAGYLSSNSLTRKTISRTARSSSPVPSKA